MNWLFQIILNNSFFKRFIPAQDIDKEFIDEDKLKEKRPGQDYYEDLTNMH